MRSPRPHSPEVRRQQDQDRRNRFPPALMMCVPPADELGLASGTLQQPFLDDRQPLCHLLGETALGHSLTVCEHSSLRSGATALAAPSATGSAQELPAMVATSSSGPGRIPESPCRCIRRPRPGRSSSSAPPLGYPPAHEEHGDDHAEIEVPAPATPHRHTTSQPKPPLHASANTAHLPMNGRQRDAATTAGTCEAAAMPGDFRPSPATRPGSSPRRRRWDHRHDRERADRRYAIGTQIEHARPTEVS